MSARMRSHTFFSPFHMFHSIRNVYTSKSNSKRLLDVETDFIIQSNISFLFLLSFELEFCFFFDHFYSIWKWKLTEQSIKLLDLNVIWGGGLANYCVKKKKNLNCPKYPVAGHALCCWQCVFFSSLIHPLPYYTLNYFSNTLCSIDSEFVLL